MKILKIYLVKAREMFIFIKYTISNINLTTVVIVEIQNIFIPILCEKWTEKTNVGVADP